jgi:hypothetical protein
MARAVTGNLRDANICCKCSRQLLAHLTNWMGRIVGSYLGVLLTQLPQTAFAPPWITRNTLCFNAFVISWVAVEPKWGSQVKRSSGTNVTRIPQPA